MRRFTNVYRMAYLAEQHPMVKSVARRKVKTCSEKSEFDNIGRCSRFRQSPFNLQITLAAFGAEWTAGCIVKNTQQDLLSLWWKPGAKFSDEELAIAEATFYDIVEALHLPVRALAATRPPLSAVAPSGAFGAKSSLDPPPAARAQAPLLQ